MDFDQLHVRRGIRLAAGLLVAMGLTLIPAAVRAQTADSASAPAFTDEISEPPAADWSRIDDAAPDSAGQVLELPQVVAADETADDSAATTMDSADEAAALPAGDEAGNLGDYEDQQTVAREFAKSPPTRFYPAVGGWRFVVIPPPSVIIVRPGGLTALPSTSPLLTTPRGSGPIFGGWWHRIH